MGELLLRAEAESETAAAVPVRPEGHLLHQLLSLHGGTEAEHCQLASVSLVPAGFRMLDRILK